MKTDIKKALKEASISIACALDEEPTTQDLEHIQSQITILENLLDEATMKTDNVDKLLANPCTPYWMREVSRRLGRVDPVDAIHGLQALADAMDEDHKAHTRQKVAEHFGDKAADIYALGAGNVPGLRVVVEGEEL